MSTQKKSEMDLADRLARAMSKAVSKSTATPQTDPAPKAARCPKAPEQAPASKARWEGEAPGRAPRSKAAAAAKDQPAQDNVVEMRPGISAAPAQGEMARWPLPGLAPMTRVRTDFGDVHSIALREGDKVLTRKGEYRAIRWIKRIRLDAHVLNAKPDSNPVVIAPGALGNQAEIAVSPRQKIVADETSGLQDAREAAMLLSHTGVRRLRETGLTYTMFHLGKPSEVCVEGLYLEFPMEA